VAARFFTVGLASLGDRPLEPAIRQALADQLPRWRDELARACRAGNWPARVRSCLAAAGTRAEVDACTRQLDDDQRAALESWYTQQTH
jgi:hypothetical protein